MDGRTAMIDPELLEILACPDCKEPVEQQDGYLVCIHCGKRYPVREGIPAMRPEDAEPPSPDWKPRR